VGARLVAVGDAELEVSDWGSGDPIVFLPTALVADELVPLATSLPWMAFVNFSTTGGATPAVVESSTPVRSQAMPMTFVPGLEDRLVPIFSR
jgi:hypothetical protein